MNCPEIEIRLVTRREGLDSKLASPLSHALQSYFDPFLFLAEAKNIIKYAIGNFSFAEIIRSCKLVVYT